jgi:hypothetical protein
MTMAWRPIRYLVEGEMDNTVPGKVTGWLQFARMKDKVVLDLVGDFHRDIRGTRIHLSGDGCRERTGYLYGFSPRQTGKAGDMTAGYPPLDCRYGPWFEWYSEQNGRVLLEPVPRELTIYGRRLPVDQCEPISREAQERLYADFLRQAARHARTAAAAAMASQVPSDPAFSHWVIVDDRIVGEAHNVQLEADGYSGAYIQRFDEPGHVHYERIETDRLRGKNVARWIA